MLCYEICPTLFKNERINKDLNETLRPQGELWQLR